MRYSGVAIIMAAILFLLAAGCGRDENPVGMMDKSTVSRPTTPLENGSVGDFVWLDVNQNGIQDEGEPGIEGVLVHLYLCDSSIIMGVDTTDAEGHYAFEGLDSASYYLWFMDPYGHVFSMVDQGSDDELDSDVDPATGETACFTIGDEDSDLSWDAGLFAAQPEPASLGDHVWYDENMNGYQDTGEVGIENVTVNLYACTGEMLGTTITDEHGDFMFDSLMAGDYYLEFVPLMGYVFSPKDQMGSDIYDSDADPVTGMTDCVTLADGEAVTTMDAGMYLSEGGCTYSKGYWKNHAGFGPQEDVVSDLLPIWLGTADADKSVAVTSTAIAVDILTMKVFGHPSNGITKLYAQLLAARLNIANGAGMADIVDALDEADTFLAEHDWNEWWDMDRDMRHMILDWMELFDDYNNGYIGPGHCDENDDDDYFGVMSETAEY